MTNKNDKDNCSLVFTTDYGTTIFNPDGTNHFIHDPAQEDAFWVSLGCQLVGRKPPPPKPESMSA
jgi:hypothetical protein